MPKPKEIKNILMPWVLKLQLHLIYKEWPTYKQQLLKHPLDCTTFIIQGDVISAYKEIFNKLKDMSMMEIHTRQVSDNEEDKS